MFAPPQLFGRGLRPRRVLGSPLKSIGGSGREPLYIESPLTNSIWLIRQRTLARNMPGLFQKMRDSGNNIMNPLDLIPCETLEEFDENPVVLDLLMNGIAQPYSASLFGFPSPTGGLSINDYFAQLYTIANQNPSINVIERVLKTFGILSGILRNDFACGFGKDIYIDMISWAGLFMPLLGRDFGAIYTLVEHMYRMTDKDEDTLRRLLAMMPFQYQGQVLAEAAQTSGMEPTFLSINIGRVCMGLPSIYP
ncbi:hypothetical protein BKA65DRAFT_17899 [Rhexocercosporidium sp. MPI-PUGE-AT-0058]|nr:hypothetical protein BKA65DRAFT_17899 [Rhexocercosporidium sp. MPI-PUGE-AT-0058]